MKGVGVSVPWEKSPTLLYHTANLAMVTQNAGVSLGVCIVVTSARRTSGWILEQHMLGPTGSKSLDTRRS